MAKFKGPKTVSSVGFGKNEYPVKNGVVDVPEEAAEHMESHGFKRHSEEAEGSGGGDKSPDEIFLEQKVADIGTALAAGGRTAEQLEALKALESAAKKPRAGVLEAIGEATAKLQQPPV